MWTALAEEDRVANGSDEADDLIEVPRPPTKEEQDEVKVPYVELEEDTFGMWVCSLARDAHFVAKESSPQGARKFRMFTVVFLLIFTLCLQIWLLAKVKQFVSAKAVHDIRIAYGLFEETMCGEDVTFTHHHYARCNPGAFPDIEDAKAKLNEMEGSDQGDICGMPLSQPYFFAAILLVWTITCVSEVRNAVRLQIIILSLPTSKSMAKATTHLDGREDSDYENPDEIIVIRSLTCLLKVVITLTSVLPRVSITVYLLWIGCRWLLGTNSFDEMILNAIALEFILLMKDSIYMALMPTQSKEARACTMIHPVWKKSKLTYHSVFLQSFGLLLVSIAWVLAYMYLLQDVLPGYQFDVNAVCEDYIKTRFEV